MIDIKIFLNTLVRKNVRKSARGEFNTMEPDMLVCARLVDATDSPGKKRLLDDHASQVRGMPAIDARFDSEGVGRGVRTFKCHHDIDSCLGNMVQMGYLRCTSFFCAISVSVLSPHHAANATLALKFSE